MRLGLSICIIYICKQSGQFQMKASFKAKTFVKKLVL